MFFTIKYGADEQQIFNPDCNLEHLIQNIRRRCQCPLNYDVALVDEKYSILHLADQAPMHTSSSSLFTERGTYILVAYDKKNGKYIPLLDSIDSELAAKLDMLSHPRGDQRLLARNWSKNPRGKYGTGPPAVVAGLGQGRARRMSATPAFIKKTKSKS